MIFLFIYEEHYNARDGGDEYRHHDLLEGKPCSPSVPFFHHFVSPSGGHEHQAADDGSEDKLIRSEYLIEWMPDNPAEVERNEGYSVIDGKYDGNKSFERYLLRI